jgi:hypothetical protein
MQACPSGSQPVVSELLAADLHSMSRSSQPSNAMLGCGSTTPQDYPEWSGFGGQREREWGTGGGSYKRCGPTRPIPIRLMNAPSIWTRCLQPPVIRCKGDCRTRGATANGYWRRCRPCELNERRRSRVLPGGGAFWLSQPPPSTARRDGLSFAFFRGVVGMMAVAFSAAPRKATVAGIGGLSWSRTGRSTNGGFRGILSATAGATMGAVGRRGLLAGRHWLTDPADTLGFWY